MNQPARIEKDLLFLKTGGPFAEIGRHYGSALKREIAEQVQHSIARFRRMGNPHQREVAIRTVSESFRSNFPYLWDEIGGICSGSGVDREEFLEHLFISAVPVFQEGEDDGCTDIIFPDSDVGPLLGKTHDASSPDRGLAVVRAVAPEERYAVLCVTHVDGLSMMAGLNEQGLAVGDASLHFHTSNRQGTVRTLLPRAILHECANVAEAVDFLAHHPPLRFGYHFALVDESGRSAIVERSPTEQSVRWGNADVLFCTNHTATPAMRALEKSRGELGDRNSDTRFENLQKLVSDAQFEASLNGMEELLRFHHEVGGICQHGDPRYTGPKLEFYPMFTRRAFINIVQGRELLVSNGNPCRSPFHSFKLN